MSLDVLEIVWHGSSWRDIPTPPVNTTLVRQQPRFRTRPSQANGELVAGTVSRQVHAVLAASVEPLTTEAIAARAQVSIDSVKWVLQKGRKQGTVVTLPGRSTGQHGQPCARYEVCR